MDKRLDCNLRSCMRFRGPFLGRLNRRNFLQLAVLALSLPSTAAFAGVHCRTPTGQTWVCNAYGYGGSKNTWRMIAGDCLPSKTNAIESAEHECFRKGLHACRKNGCSEH